jgi:two-component system, OmpR family, sensor kinase
MSERTDAARSPLFLRIFVLMLACILVVQLMNVVLLVAMQTPSARLYTVGQIVSAIRAGHDPGREFRIDSARSVTPAPWSPRVERTQLALAKALGVAPQRVQIRFPTPVLQRAQTYDRRSVPRTEAPETVTAARNVVISGDFSAALQRADGGWLRVDSNPGFEAWRWAGLLWLLLSGAAAAPFAWMLAHRIAKPIGAFAAAADRLGRDPKAAPLELDGPAEIAGAAAAFNNMQARLNRYVDDRTTVIGAVAHDLRTPLMRLQLRLEGAADPVRAACEGDIREMQAMLSAALAYVRETGEPAVRRALDLRSLAETVTDDMSDRGADVRLAPGEPVVIEGHPAALKALVTNLLTNAVKYAGGAEVALARVEDHAVIEVRDDGPGMAEADLERAFEPFFRAERSRNRDTGGMGLGLASVRAVARSHGGDVTLANRPEGGLVARVRLPV